ncbi:hypothetical protein BpHYR1_028359 [Brachionus plicatilis]|uniref:Uncharacterized protein n=1 Tax=Brachionus plicatilis TaxID=10195 RepID=A0A3M7QFM8_BRAPC|nr:hypothetical protein BpHYR1_028359 [Brachionus plicatilis]
MIMFQESLQRPPFHLGLPTLSERRTRGDMIQMFKIRSGLNNIDWVRPPPHCSSLSQPGPAQDINNHQNQFLHLNQYPN